ncbi:MAG: hypothetical protein KDC66_06660 [Phaeodactylibacter sp.]|nr:hypothetical protein [Phaeodactylibacter sp.]MCB9275941.1 hypothetical protein [Lewinellaceae bacterium]
MKHCLIFLASALAFAASGPLAAQAGKLHVITKRLDKSFAFKTGYEVNIEGEKAEVVIETWEKPEISVRMELIARHPEKAVAEADLEKMKFMAERVRNKIYLRNYISAEEGEAKPQSNLEARYLITLPAECPVYLKNYFGISNVSNLANRFRFFGEFSKIGMENVQGAIDLRSRFGDIVGRSLGGEVSINAHRSDITLEDIQGRYDIDAQYGIIRILSSAGLLDLDINAEKSDIYLFDPKLNDFGFLLTAQEGQINYPGDLRMNFLSNTESLKKVEVKPKQEYYPSITITVTFGDIYLEKEKPANAKF